MVHPLSGLINILLACSPSTILSSQHYADMDCRPIVSHCATLTMWFRNLEHSVSGSFHRPEIAYLSTHQFLIIWWKHIDEFIREEIVCYLPIEHLQYMEGWDSPLIHQHLTSIIPWKASKLHGNFKVTGLQQLLLYQNFFTITQRRTLRVPLAFNESILCDCNYQSARMLSGLLVPFTMGYMKLIYLSCAENGVLQLMHHDHCHLHSPPIC